MKVRFLKAVGDYKANETYEIDVKTLSTLEAAEGDHYEIVVEVKDAPPENKSALADAVVDKVLKHFESQNKPDADNGKAKAPAILTYGRGSNKFMEEFSLCRALRGVLLNKWGPTTLEKDMLESTDTLGGFAVPIEQVPEIIPMLNAQSVMRRAGVRVYPMNSPVVEIPRQTGVTTTAWGAEALIAASGMTEQTAPTLGVLRLIAKKLYTLVEVSRDLMKDATPALERMLREDIAMQLALAEDLAYIRGVGVGSVPAGMTTLVTTNTATVAAAAMTYDDIYDAQYRVENQNSRTTGFITTPRVHNTVRKFKDANGAYMLQPAISRGEPDTLSGIPAFKSTQVNSSTTHYLINGDFEREAIIGQREDLEIMQSTEAKFANDLIVIKAQIRVDFALRHEEAFNVTTVTY